jgi:hypothetical protein
MLPPGIEKFSFYFGWALLSGFTAVDLFVIGKVMMASQV